MSTTAQKPIVVTPETADVNEIARAVALIATTGSVHELRVMKTRDGNLSGYFNSPKKLIEEAARLSGKAPGVYITLNPVDPALFARAENRTVQAKRTTSDADIVSLKWLLVDFDPKRPSGISSTNEEHSAAIVLARRCRDFLKSTGWPEGIVADSGNGAHLLLRVDLPNSTQSSSLLRKVLEALAFHFNDEIVEVDQKTFNPSRICKLYGTRAAKGDSTHDRPHRLSKLLDVPDAIPAVGVQQLEDLARKVPQKQHGGRGTRIDIQGWIEKNGILISRTTEWNGGQKWVLTTCPWNDAHTDKSAYIVQFPNGAVAAGCHHDGCRGKGWRDLRALFPLSAADDLILATTNQYQETENGIVWLKEKGQSISQVANVALAAGHPRHLAANNLSDALARTPIEHPAMAEVNHKPEDFAFIKKQLEKLLSPEIKRHEVALRMEPDGLIISLREVGFFDSGSDQIKPQAIDAIRRIAGFLQSRACDLRIEGHTDNVPIHTASFASNWELSTGRATALVKLLIEDDGFAPERLSAAGYGEFHPVADNSSVAGQQMNRRVDIVLLPETLPPAQLAASAKPAFAAAATKR